MKSPNTVHSPEDLSAELTSLARALPPGKRFMLGLIGVPGAGKSTTANLLVQGVNREAGEELAVMVPMDGFHRYNSELRRLNLLELKGVPDSFDAKAFVALLSRIRAGTDKTVLCPCFDRAIEEPTEDAIAVEPRHKLVVVEGNYLLLDRPPWDAVRGILDQIWFIDSDMDEIVSRLQIRHETGGRDKEAARVKMESTDLPNARLIEATKERADRVIILPRLNFEQ